MAPGVGLLQGPRVGWFLMGEVLLQPNKRVTRLYQRDLTRVFPQLESLIPGPF